MSAAPETDQPDDKKKQDRSPSFPFISLREAVEKAKAFQKEEGRNSASYDVTVGHWKYAPKSSGGKRTVAALRAYGLMELDPKGRYKLTPAALQIVLDTAEKAKAIRDSALKPVWFQKIWERHGADLPSDKNLKNTLYLNEGFTEDAADDFIKAYKDTIVFAGLNNSDKLSSQPEDNTEIQVGDYVQWESQGVDQFKAPKKVVGFWDSEHAKIEGENGGARIDQLRKVDPPAGSEERGKGIVIEAVGSTRRQPLPPKPGMNQDVFTLEEGDVMIQWPKALSAASYQDLEDWLELIKRKAKRAIKLEATDLPSTEPVEDPKKYLRQL